MRRVVGIEAAMARQHLDEGVERNDQRQGIGDRVTIPFLNEQGVVAGNPDSKGRIRVLVKGKKMELPVKRVKRSIPAEELYPDDYDLNIVLLSKEERKMKHRMERGLLHGVERIIPPEEQ